MKRLIYLLSLGFFTLSLQAQNVVERVVEQLVETDDGMDQAVWEERLEELSYLREQPLNINTISKQQLELFPFLSARMIENILYYLDRYGPMKTDKELMMVEDMDLETCRLLRQFVYVGEVVEKVRRPSLATIARYGKHEVSTRLDVPMYERRGYREDVYEGSPLAHNLRYQFRYSDRVMVGVTAAKDAGEPFFAGRNSKGYDSYSPYLYLRDFGRVRAVALGNYRLSYGYGMVVNTNFSMGKTFMLGTLDNRVQGIRKHSSTDEYNYLQGGALSYALGRRWSVDAFYSSRQMDGNLSDAGEITSIKKDGLHRRDLEWDKHNTFRSRVLGGNVTYDGRYVDVGTTVAYQHLDKRLNPTPHDYNRYYARGNDFLNVGVNYRAVWHRFTLQGETAADKVGHLAMMNTLRFDGVSDWQLMLMQRYYEAAYASLLARGVGEGSSVQNESGVYIGAEGKLMRYVRASLYADCFYFPWYRYQVSKKGTMGFDGGAQLTFSPRPAFSVLARYRYKRKHHDHTPDGADKATMPFTTQRLKLQVDYKLSPGLTLRSSVDGSRVQYEGCPSSMGVLLGQSVGYDGGRLPLQVDVSFVWFDTDDYDSRLYAYERGVLYSFSMPSFYGEGHRVSSVVRWAITPHVILQFKLAVTHYRDREVIGSGYDRVDGSDKSDVNCLLRLKF